MKIPKKLKIGGHIVRVNCSQRLEGLNGEAIIEKNLIKICKDIPQDQKESTLLHEILHFCNSTIGDDNNHHLIIDGLAEQLYQVLKDNNLLR